MVWEPEERMGDERAILYSLTAEIERNGGEYNVDSGCEITKAEGDDSFGDRGVRSCEHDVDSSYKRGGELNDEYFVDFGEVEGEQGCYGLLFLGPDCPPVGSMRCGTCTGGNCVEV